MSDWKHRPSQSRDRAEAFAAVCRGAMFLLLGVAAVTLAAIDSGAFQ